MYPQLLVVSGVMDVRDRYFRALAGLDEARSAADSGTRTVLSGFHEHVQSLYRDFHRTITEHLEGIRAAFGDDPRDWPQEDLDPLALSAVRGFDTLSAAHDDFCAHLPGVTRARDDLLFLLIRSLNFSLMSRAHTRLLSVQQSTFLTWEASRFSSLESAQPVAAAAIAVPWLETLSPLRWPLAVHEVGHYFLPGDDARLVSPLLKTIAYEQGWRDHNYTSFKEIVADAVAQRAFGDAYALAFAREGYLLSYATHLEGGVSVKTRLELLGGPQSLIENLPKAWRFDALPDADNAPGGDTGGARARQLPETSEEDRLRMRSYAEELVQGIPVNDPRAVAAARDLIRASEPPSAVLLCDPSDVDALQKLTATLSTGTPLDPQDVAALTGLAVHRSLSDGEILEAAWLEDYERDEGSFLAHFASTTLSEQDLEAAVQAVTQADTWLSRALQSAAVHRWLEQSETLAKAGS